jgi:hypothetical protein
MIFCVVNVKLLRENDPRRTFIQKQNSDCHMYIYIYVCDRLLMHIDYVMDKGSK